MSILVLIHAATEGPALLGRALADRGHDLRQIHLYRGDTLPTDLREVHGLVSMGGPMNVGDAAQYPFLSAEMDLLRRAHAARLPMVGVCLGAQLIGAALGGEVGALAGGPEIGFADIRLSFPGTTDPIFAGLPWTSPQFHFHGQEVSKLPPDGVPLAGSAKCRNQAFRVGLSTYAFQFHFEWDQHDLDLVARDAFVAQAGLTTEKILAELPGHYLTYRRLGDRLGMNLAELLFAGALVK